MATKLPISVFIITLDEQDRIGHAINSVMKWAGEVIVIDSGSTDDTVAYSQRLGARALYNEWQGFGPQKVFGERQCKHDWVLNIDADEEVTPQLANEIALLFSKGTPGSQAYHVPIKIMGRFAKKPGMFAPSNSPVRLYNRQFAGFKDSPVHDSVLVNSGGKVARLRCHMNHRSFRSYRHAVEKINYYTDLQAVDIVAKRRKIPAIRILAEPFLAFFKAYFLRRYILLGIEGFIEGVIYAFARTLRLAKARELTKIQAGSSN